MRILCQIMQVQQELQERPWAKHQFQTPRLCLCYLVKGNMHAYLVAFVSLTIIKGVSASNMPFV